MTLLFFLNKKEEESNTRVTFLTMPAKGRLASTLKLYKTVLKKKEAKCTHEFLGLITGLARPTVSRELKKLKRK